MPREWYTESREGLLYAADGWGAVRRFDGLQSGWEDAGVPAPENAPYFYPVAFPLGFISGSWVAYSRYLDRYGNPGNPSPASTTLTIADVSGTVEELSNATPMVVKSTAHGLIDATGRLDIPGTSIGPKIVMRWPVSGTETEYYYDVVDEDHFSLYTDSGLTSGLAPDDAYTAGGQWAQNISGFTYDLANGEVGTEVLGTVASNSDPNSHTFRTNASHGLTANIRPGLADGRVSFIIGGGTSTAGPYYFLVVNSNHLGVYDDDECTSPVNLASAGIANSDPYSAYNFEVPSLPSAVTTVQVLRTKSGSGVAAYVDQESDDPTTTYFESSLTDDELGEELVLIDPFTGDASYALRFGLPPEDKPYLSAVGGRMVAAGDPIWTQGTVAVTNGSATVTGTGTQWPEAVAGRTFYLAGKAYEIESRASATSLTLTKTYAGSTASGQAYAIGPAYRGRRFVQYSEAGYSEAFHPLNGVFLPADSDGGKVTGNCSYDSSALIFCESRTFRFSFVLDPKTDGQCVAAFDRGCVNNRCWVRTDEAVYALDRRGVYRTDGQSATDISGAIQDIFATHNNDYAINWEEAELFHGIFDAENESVLFFVSMTEFPSPRYCLAYRLQTQAWELLYFPVAMMTSAVARIAGRQRVVCGTSYGKVVVLDEGLRDGTLEAGTLSGTVTSATDNTLTDSGASFGDVANCPVFIVAGTGKGQEARIASNTGTVLTLTADWNTNPDATSRYVIGGIHHVWKSGWFDWVPSDKEQPRAVGLTFKPSAVASTYDLRVYEDQSDDAKVMGVTHSEYGITTRKGSDDLTVDMTKANGYARRQLDFTKEVRADGPRRVSIELEGYTNGDVHTLYQAEIEGAA